MIKADPYINNSRSELFIEKKFDSISNPNNINSVDIATAIQDQIRALKDLAREQAKKDKAKK